MFVVLVREIKSGRNKTDHTGAEEFGVAGASALVGLELFGNQQAEVLDSSCAALFFSDCLVSAETP